MRASRSVPTLHRPPPVPAQRRPGPPSVDPASPKLPKLPKSPAVVRAAANGEASSPDEPPSPFSETAPKRARVPDDGSMSSWRGGRPDPIGLLKQPVAAQRQLQDARREKDLAVVACAAPARPAPQPRPPAAHPPPSPRDQVRALPP